MERHGKLILMHEKGAPATPRQAARLALVTGKPVGIGMFPRGDFKRSTLRKAWMRLSLARGRPLKAWTVAGLLAYAAEELLRLHG